MSLRDPRLTPAREDLAAAHLREVVAAPRYVEGRICRVSAPLLDLKRQPRPDAGLDTQLLLGETVRVYDEAEGWAWVQAERDGYVGYVATHGLAEAMRAPTHQVVTRRTFVYPAADMKQPIALVLPMGARVVVEDDRGSYLRLAGGGFVFRTHLVELHRTPVQDAVSIAEALVGTPYLWGGRSPDGIDCSGLVQLSFGMAGTEMPRDTHMQEALGVSLPFDEGDTGLRRGDLVFWRGHVGIMADGETLIHANGHHMLVHKEPLRTARDRIAGGENGSHVTSTRRLP